MPPKSGKSIRDELGENPRGAHLKRAIADGHAKIVSKAGKERITYLAVDQSENYDDPEEWVRADFWAELIYTYQYRPECIAIEVSVPDRMPSDFVDLAVCRDEERTTPYAVIECKPDGVSEAEFEQAVEQAVGNGTWSKLRADFVMVVAGPTRRVLDVKNHGIAERKKNRVADLPIKYGKPSTFKYVKSGSIDLEQVDRAEMISVLRKCHTTLWGGGESSPPQAFADMCKLLFLKISDENTTRKGKPYQVQVKTAETAEELHERIAKLYSDAQAKSPDVLVGKLDIAAPVLLPLVEHLQSVNLNATDIDVKGLAFERFMDGFFKGDFGQYFTPRDLIEFAIDMLDVEPEHRVIDPSCGSGGFLLHALRRVQTKAAEYSTSEVEQYRTWQTFVSNQLFGIEISGEIARVAKTNMILHGDGHTNVAQSDGLLPWDKLAEIAPGFAADSFDRVFTNPPFGAAIKLATSPHLANYELAVERVLKGGKKKIRKSQKSEIVFIERIIDCLKPGTGTAAIVLPDGVLTNESLRYVRNYMLDRLQFLAVVSLPATAFMHYGAGVKASLVFVRRLGRDEVANDDSPVFLAEVEHVGYDATGRTAQNQLPEVAAAYRQFRRDAEPFIVDTSPLEQTSVVDPEVSNDEAPNGSESGSSSG